MSTEVFHPIQEQSSISFPFSREDDIEFWYRQLGEHSLFVSMGLDEKSVVNVPSGIFPGNLKTEGNDLFFLWQRFDHHDIPYLRQLIDLTEDYHLRILNLLDTGRWIGFVPKAMIEHQLDELRYFRNKVNLVPFDIDIEVKFWKDLNEDHVALEQKLIDAGEDAATKTTLDLVDKFKLLDNSELIYMIQMTQFYGEQLNNYNKDIFDGKIVIANIIHPLLLAHVIREGDRSTVALGKIKQIYPLLF